MKKRPRCKRKKEFLLLLKKLRKKEKKESILLLKKKLRCSFAHHVINPEQTIKISWGWIVISNISFGVEHI